MSRESNFTFYEFFAGGGMARLGLGTRWRCLFANDFDAVKAATYRENFQDADQHFHEGDVWKVELDQLPGTADLAWASSPCQDFSLAGARAGLKGGRSSAFFGFWQLMEGLSVQGRAPRMIVIENVVGLLTSHDGRDFEALCRALAMEGYFFGALEIDAARFVPQSRPRVFVVATRDQPPPKLAQIEPKAPFHSRRVVSSFDRLPKRLKKQWVWWRLNYPPSINEDISAVLERDEAAKWWPQEKVSSLLALLGERHKEKLEVAKARNERVVGTIFRRMRTEEGKKVQRAEIRFDGVAGCLRTPRGGSSQQFVIIVQSNDVRVRALTSYEAGQLMGLPHNYNLPERRTAALSVVGDGVAVPVVEFLRRTILEPMLRAGGTQTHARKETCEVANAR